MTSCSSLESYSTTRQQSFFSPGYSRPIIVIPEEQATIVETQMLPPPTTSIIVQQENNSIHYPKHHHDHRNRENNMIVSNNSSTIDTEVRNTITSSPPQAATSLEHPWNHTIDTPRNSHLAKGNISILESAHFPKSLKAPSTLPTQAVNLERKGQRLLKKLI